MKPSITFTFLATLILLIGCDSGKIKKAQVENYSLIDSLLMSAIEKNEIPGAVAYIKMGEQVVHHKAYGWNNIENKVELQKTDIFRMASMTKGLTAVAVLQLLEQEKLQLTDSVSKYIPEFKQPEILTEVLADSSFKSVPAKNEITIQHLLTHTSGIGYGFQDDKYNALIVKYDVSEGFEDDNRTSMENIQRIAKIPLLCEPGEKFIYSLSYDVLGVVIEVVSGLRYDEYITRNILKPLQMNDSYFIVPESERMRLVSVYQPTNDKKGVESTTYPDVNYPVIEDRQYFSGGADLCSTAEDYAKFVSMVKNKGEYSGKRVLGAEFINMMLSKQTNLDDGGWDQGFSTWVANEQGAKDSPMNVGAFGFGGFFDTYSWTDPKEDLIAVLLLQMYPNNAHDIHSKFQEAVYRVIKQ